MQQMWKRFRLLLLRDDNHFGKHGGGRVGLPSRRFSIVSSFQCVGWVSLSCLLRRSKHFPVVIVVSAVVRPRCRLLSQQKEHYKIRNLNRKKQKCPFAVLGLSAPSSLESRTAAEDSSLITALPFASHTSASTSNTATLTFAEVKKAFLKIAMRHHPDTATANSPDEVERNRDTFIAARGAFEEIAEGPEGMAILKSMLPNNHNNYNDDDLDWGAWFQNETGHSMPYMDLKTMREVAEMTETVGHGLDRDGGMWTLAQMVTDNIKKGGDGTSLLRLEAGESRDRSIDGILRRRRRR